MVHQPSSQKTRHYAMLASRIKTLQNELVVTEQCMGEMAKQLESMAKLGAYCGSQSVLLSISMKKGLGVTLLYSFADGPTGL